MDRAIRDAMDNEHEFNTNMDDLTAALRALGVEVDIPYNFCDIALLQGHETYEEYEEAEELRCIDYPDDDDWRGSSALDDDHREWEDECEFCGAPIDWHGFYCEE